MNPGNWKEEHVRSVPARVVVASRRVRTRRSARGEPRRSAKKNREDFKAVCQDAERAGRDARDDATGVPHLLSVVALVVSAFMTTACVDGPIDGVVAMNRAGAPAILFSRH